MTDSTRSFSAWLVVMPLMAIAATSLAQQGTVSTSGTGTAGVRIESFTAFPDVVVQTGNASASAFRIFNSANTELFRVSANGNVGIGTTSPSQKLEIFNGTSSGAVVVSTPGSTDFAPGAPIGGLRLAWQFGSFAPNSVDLQAVRGSGATDGAGLAIFTSPSNTQSVERMRITSAGRVGIGMSDPSQPLEVNGNVLVRPATGSFSVGKPAPPGYAFHAASTTPGVSSALQLRSNYANASTSYAGNFGTFGTYLAHNRDPQNGAFVDAAAAPNQGNAAQLVLGDTMPGRLRLFSIANFPGGVEMIRFVVKYDGNVGIGPGVEQLMAARPDKRLVVAGDIEVSGNINAKFQDVAEWVDAADDLQPGTVVVLDPDRDNRVMTSSRAYDTTVAGVVSAQPGLTLGETAAEREAIATMGRVRVRVDATAAPIAIGDLLVTSDRPGYAMKSTPIDVAGRALHRPGTIIGKALQPLAGGAGEILVLLSMH